MQSMEVYAPKPDEVVRGSRRGNWAVGTVVLLAVVLAVVAASRFTPQPDFRNFGTVQTRFGTAGVVCGGDGAPPCGQATGLEFPECTQAVRDYFSGQSDARARELVGARPPTGKEWYFVCGSSALIRGRPALLEPS
jgi:hypothetical protein